MISIPIIIITAICLIGITLRPLNKASEKRRFAELVDEVSKRINELQDLLDKLLLPDKRVTKEQVNSLLSRYKDTIDQAQTLLSSPKANKSILRQYRIEELLEIITLSTENRIQENNEIFDAIQLLSTLCADASQRFDTLMDDTHYFTHSEMQQFKTSLSDIEICEETVLPKYADFVKDDSVKRILSIKKDLEKMRAEHNNIFVERELAANKSYFDTVLGKYPLDFQQRLSLVKLEDNCLVTASAGSGKTSTILGKAKYLVERCGIDPARILLITYTRKAANELHQRMKIDGITCSTFHALAYHIIAETTGQAPSICNADLPLNIFRKLVMEDPKFLHAINNYIINQQSLMRLEHDYNNAFAYFEDRKKYGIQALFPDVDGRLIFTRSEEEKRLVSLLTRWGILFRYEAPFQYNTSTPQHRQYKPDFTIYYPDGKGGWRWLYLEHLAIDNNGKVPAWFGEGERGGWSLANQKYHEGIEWKRKTHRQYGTTLIETSSADFHDGTVESKLFNQLQRYGVPIRQRSDRELYDMLISRSRKLENSVFTLIQSFVTLMKANEKDIDTLVSSIVADNNQLKKHIRSINILMDVIKPFYDEYQRTLQQQRQIDFTDAIIRATTLCRQGLWKQYDFILVDEFQDISVDRYKFLQALRRHEPLTKLYCVGDDWQSIYRFAGSDMSLFYEFEQYFGFTEQCKIETTYRFHQPLINMSSEFIIKNPEQKAKTIVPPDGDSFKTWLSFKKCASHEKDSVLKNVEAIVERIPTTQSIMLLGRYNYDAMSVGFNGQLDTTNNHILVRIGGRGIPFLSVHSAKGLEADHVILINCNSGAYGFPSLIEDDPILDFVLSKKESYPYAEERRLFYVAMTRARMHMYVLYDSQNPSPFVSEFLLQLEKGSYLCPKCLSGKMTVVREGVASSGVEYRSFRCSNNEGGCDFFETKYGDLTPPGIQITESMTAQDIERLRENRRNARVLYST